MKAGEVAEIIDMFIREHGNVDICDVSLHLKLGIYIYYANGATIAMQFYSFKKIILKSKTDKTYK